VARHYSAFFAHRPGGLFILGKIFDLRVITANLILPGRKLEIKDGASPKNDKRRLNHSIQLLVSFKLQPLMARWLPIATSFRSML
jgi:hypothetical protein